MFIYIQDDFALDIIVKTKQNGATKMCVSIVVVLEFFLVPGGGMNLRRVPGGVPKSRYGYWSALFSALQYGVGRQR